MTGPAWPGPAFARDGHGRLPAVSKPKTKMAGRVIGQGLQMALVVVLWEAVGLVGPLAFFAFMLAVWVVVERQP